MLIKERRNGRRAEEPCRNISGSLYQDSCSSPGDRQRDSGLLPGNNSTTRRAGAKIVQQGPTHPKDGLVYPRTLPERQIYIHGARRTCHGALHHIQEGEKNPALHTLYVTFLQDARIKVSRKLRHFWYFSNSASRT